MTAVFTNSTSAALSAAATSAAIALSVFVVAEIVVFHRRHESS
jgi:hypothetical protein